MTRFCRGTPANFPKPRLQGWQDRGIAEPGYADLFLQHIAIAWTIWKKNQNPHQLVSIENANRKKGLGGRFGLSGTGDSQRDSCESIRASHSQLKPLFL